MRLLKLGKITKRGKFGVRVLTISAWNPFRDWFVFGRSGYGRWLRLPGVKFLWLKECGQGQRGKRMKKIDIITNCLECSWFVRKMVICGRTQRLIVLDNIEAGFPDWCTLPDATEPK